MRTRVAQRTYYRITGTFSMKRGFQHFIIVIQHYIKEASRMPARIDSMPVYSVHKSKAFQVQPLDEA